MYETYLKRITSFPQRQDSTHDQLADLRIVANRLGMYDAADVLRKIIETNEEINQ
jgi:outer membrane protein assembly factor BamD (BamD/ComL family)